MQGRLHTLPGENEIRTEISRFFGKKKVSSDVGFNDNETEVEPHGRRGRKGILSDECIKYLEDLVQGTLIKPADALRHINLHYPASLILVSMTKQ